MLPAILDKLKYQIPLICHVTTDNLLLVLVLQNAKKNLENKNVFFFFLITFISDAWYKCGWSTDPIRAAWN